MVVPLRPTSRVSTRVALSATGLVACDDHLRSGNAGDVSGWRFELTPPPAEGVAWPALGAALRELASAYGAEMGSLVIALLAPLVEVRRIQLPPLRDDERVRVLSRTAARHFLNVQEQQVVGVAPTGGNRDSAVVAAAVPARIITMIHAEATHVGWRIGSIVPAEAAWASGAIALWPSFAKGKATVLVAHEDRVDLVQTDDARITGVRRFRAAAADTGNLVEAVQSTGTSDVNRVGIIGTPVEARELAAALRGFGISALLPPSQLEAATASPVMAAASFVVPTERFRLRTDDAVAMRAAGTTRAAWQIGGIAALVLMLAAAIEWWGVKRDLDEVKEQRALIAQQVRDILSGQQKSGAAARRIAGITESHQSSPQWSVAIAALSRELDASAHLINLRARGDTVLLDGLAARSSRVFESLERTPGVSNVRAAGEMRVERQEDGTMLERFSIQARVTRIDRTHAQ